jgi:hypothetical protein
LTKLDISGDFFPGAAAGKAIGNMLAGNRTLKDLDISKCCIDAESAQEISLGLSDNGALTSLNLASNSIGGYHHGYNNTQFTATPEGISYMSILYSVIVLITNS